MADIPVQILKVARPIHWIKNLALFAALFFTSNFFEASLVKTVLLAFISFSFAASAAYVFNDIVDAEKDKRHPVKKYRPIASGKLSKKIALIEVFVLLGLSFIFSINLNILFHLTLIFYVVLQALYSMFLKNITTIDILTIAFGFVIRIYAGAFVINAHLSVWFLLCVISTALFLAAGKRRSELNIPESASGITRASLSKYSKELLNSYVTMFGNASWLSWSLFAFYESPRASLDVWLLLAEISKTTTVDKLLMASIPVVIYTIMRYESLIFEGKSEAPEKIILSDKGLITSVFIWFMMVYWVYYVAVV
ncbi:MAG: 4-hydroxybenzoate octaprenyltransferase [Candidatus Woesebacteria bacterium GW2011_GWC1_38_13]|uniref:UbiA prenyltransferase n=4 Tax=Candidatus Woeseibacteriota TaxID=1752722 RepID=A0A0G0KYD0_9BACT|nr:MAG: UbiA prenyltransferase [Candidatus Woesebacteria bacterium GW2011_GWD1_38_10]KKQ54745.1 MAG: 4-hydroxybenzoate octaprenyltransferase [Candidatus Woesebacteria bacterium GW2011_GWC1_38_13]KKQ84663.1 MAG: UbiA prenyltransferase [Candidatus Woesebacteria bacterium GW2011_GWA1_38_8]